ncbi:MAG: RtcB family protein [Bacteroidales bacterium]|nr:RtcB family protein [Bacteroidales bacterium]
MQKEITTERIPIKLWLDEMEDGAMEQAKNLANLPFAFRHVAIMPDAHQGYGMPIGGVLATKDVIVPNAVGVDIGCGMCAVQTNLPGLERKPLTRIVEGIKKAIPVGFKHHKKAQDESLMPEWDEDMEITFQEYESALKQIGTLGGGNHFIEIQKGDDGLIWLMVHSGSRNIGLKVASHYNKLAVKKNEEWASEVPKNWQLAYLPVDDELGRKYLKEMQFCVNFAFANRKLMMDRIIDIFHDLAPGSVKTAPMINIAHNYAAREEHYGEQVYVHRKGATPAKAGLAGIIPGSQGMKSYIVKGKGNKESFESCSHGAGRVISRNKARKNLDFKKEVAALNKQKIIHSIRSAKDLDEAPSAYKNISMVMNHQRDLVDVMVELSPLAVVKG